MHFAEENVRAGSGSCAIPPRFLASHVAPTSDTSSCQADEKVRQVHAPGPPRRTMRCPATHAGAGEGRALCASPPSPAARAAPGIYLFIFFFFRFTFSAMKPEQSFLRAFLLGHFCVIAILSRDIRGVSAHCWCQPWMAAAGLALLFAPSLLAGTARPGRGTGVGSW